MSTFDSTKTALPDIIRSITEGKIQLPDFQRGWVWDDEHVRSLLVSVARSFPVGAVMMLDTGGDVRFQVRPVENLVFQGRPPEPEKLILDGQQRLTSLTQVLALNRPVKTRDPRGREIERYYYIDIEKALNTEQIDEAFFAVEADRKVKSNFGRQVDLDLSTTDLECLHMMFPCNQILSPNAWASALFKIDQTKLGTYFQFQEKILNAFNSYHIPVIALGKTTSKEAVCLVFEKVNTGGVSLTVFELITATFAADGFNLRDDWFGSAVRKTEGRYQRLKRDLMISGVSSTDFIQAITLLETHRKRQADIAIGRSGKQASAVSAKKVSMLSLRLEDYQRWADEVEKGFILVAKFLKKECFYSPRDMPYRTQTVPLAALLTTLKQRWLEPKIHSKLSQWFWCGILGELYGGAVETRIANDLEEVLAWIDDDKAIPRTVYDANFQPNRLNTLRSRNSAAYKGINILVLREGASDFFWKAGIQELDATDVNLDIHHIFPKDWCGRHGIESRRADCIINKTPISYKANRMIGGKAPSDYLQSIQNHRQVQISNEDMDKLLASHRIDPATMRTDNFELFFANRRLALLEIVGTAMGKVLIQSQELEADDDFETEEEAA
ncbi:MAG: hypothetical protein JWM59_4722 [Verrucomicrobiales bacterium]|nr:hypothetical protein [Verrucomicrobiales bacterium]